MGTNGRKLEKIAPRGIIGHQSLRGRCLSRIFQSLKNLLNLPPKTIAERRRHKHVFRFGCGSTCRGSQAGGVQQECQKAVRRKDLSEEVAVRTHSFEVKLTEFAVVAFFHGPVWTVFWTNEGDGRWLERISCVV